ncbi:hypothetical protein JX266_008651 [Neoarthrinium moseri]|nr:hypothetical protein JX266_008651 [Neoarthrinium moseri]
MAAKPKTNPLNGMHTAGIFSDMSVDGPEIGTLVLIVDRAKNLPNRKTIGKQDPYTAARLGKEAKKTTTDVRGGQTPKWDQELRFTVHDSPDYYQLKLSVFNDDKKTELIGETWIDLRDIVMPGGGQNDQWHGLNCKGKYAGEIRIEITYYDTRPKPEKAAARPKPVAATPDQDGAAGSQRTPVKRRPLPTNPGSHEEVPAPSARPEHAQTPPRPQPNPPGATFIPKQSPLQALEYHTPPSARFSQQEQFVASDQGIRYATPPSHRDDPQHHRSVDRSEKFIALEDDRRYSQDQYSRSSEHDQRSVQHHGQPGYDQHSPSVLGPRQPMQQPVQDEDRPPPPPVHRVRNNSGASYDMARGIEPSPQHKGAPSTPMRHDVLRSEAHRHSVQAVPSPASSSHYPGRPIYRPYDSAPDMAKQLTYEDPSHPSPPRHHSYDSPYDHQQRSMQPTVEDVPESWTPPTTRRLSSRQEQHDELHYGSVPSPAPLNISGRGSAASGQFTTPSPVQAQRQYGAHAFTASPSPVASRDHHHDSHPIHTYSNSYGSNSDPYSGPQNIPDGTMVHRSHNFDMPPVPPTLVPGVDPILSQEISDRFHEDRRHERRYTQPAPMAAPTRGRQHSEPPANYGAQPSPHGHHHSQSRGYGVSYSSGPTTPSGPAPMANPRRHSPSPNPTHTIKRKSVSPAPPQEGRRLSGVPFGPDSYDELNPSVVSAKEETKGSEYTNAYGKIVTADGREVDPSDHLPMDTWAPEPEPKQPKQAEASSRPSPAGAQPMPPSGRRQIRITARPKSMAAVPAAYITPDVDSSPPQSTGRNRLQKKNHRVSALPAPAPPATHPLGPATAHQRNSTPPRALVRAGTFDYENYAVPYGESGVPRGSFGSGPPIPAKVPLMSGGLGPSGGGGGGGPDEWALVDEMSRIDIGTGRSRRHGGY